MGETGTVENGMRTNVGLRRRRYIIETHIAVPPLSTTSKHKNTIMGSNTTVSIDAYDHAVSSVVVFRNQAEVFRIFPVQLKVGEGA